MRLSGFLIAGKVIVLHPVPLAIDVHITYNLFAICMSGTSDELHHSIAGDASHMTPSIDLPLNGPSDKHPPMLLWSLRSPADPRLAHVTGIHMKTKRRWHFCLIDLSCWMEMWLYGMPLRFYWHPTKKDWAVPLLDRVALWRFKKIWDNGEPVVTRRPQT